MNKISIEWNSYGKEGLVEGTEERVKAVEGFEGYFITDHGRVLSAWGRGNQWHPTALDYDHCSLLSQVWGGGDIKYPCTSFQREGRRVKRNIHRLVAIAFIPNPNNLPVVNHLSYPSNHYKDLEWVTQADNCDKGANTKKHVLIDPAGNKLIVHNLEKFCRDNNLHKSSLYSKGKTKGWVYIKEANIQR